MKKELVALGFEEKEADIYLACIANERSTPTELAQKTKLKRATVYFYLEKLRGKGLITSEVRGARRGYPSRSTIKAWGCPPEERVEFARIRSRRGRRGTICRAENP